MGTIQCRELLFLFWILWSSFDYCFPFCTASIPQFAPPPAAIIFTPSAKVIIEMPKLSAENTIQAHYFPNSVIRTTSQYAFLHKHVIHFTPKIEPWGLSHKNFYEDDSVTVTSRDCVVCDVGNDEQVIW